MKIIETLKEKNLIDSKGLWTAGMLSGVLGGAIGAITNMRFLSLKDNTLYVLKNAKKDLEVVREIKKDDIVELKIKNGFLFLEVILTIKTKNFTEKYKLSSNKKQAKEIVNHLQSK